MSKTLLEIIEDDIKDGIRNDPCKCMIALAAQRHFGIPIWVNEYGEMHDAEGATEEDGPADLARHLGGLSSDLFDLMVAFDSGEKVYPGKYPIHLDTGDE